MPIHNLYLDSNSIIYDSYYKWTQMEASNSTHVNMGSDFIADRIIQSVIHTIDTYILLLKPSKCVVIAFDGVAPVAKLEQQRSRRFKSLYQNTVTRRLQKKVETELWNTASITPGTHFMHRLNETIRNAFREPSIYSLEQIIVSGSDQHGEGEHKIFDRIRQFPDVHREETTVVYGLDADLIMLSLQHLHLAPKLYLFRETPHFIQSIRAELEPNENYLLDIPQLADAIVHRMDIPSQTPNEFETSVLTPERKRRLIQDYLLLCFFLGNDFLPHFPALNIRTGGVEKMLNAYREVATPTMYLTNNENGRANIHWKHLRKLVHFLAEQEMTYIRTEHKKRGRYVCPPLAKRTAEEQWEIFNQTPLYDRALEKYINPCKEGWQRRYYQGLFEVRIDADRCRQICENYLEGLEWTLRYYTDGCPNWRWCYKYEYPPLLEDLKEYVPFFDKSFLDEKMHAIESSIYRPVSELVQLCYVLPKESLHLLPKQVSEILLREKGNWYIDNKMGEFKWAYCKYFWEAHPILPSIDINELEKSVEQCLSAI